MRRHFLLALSMLIGVGLLAGCGQKGPLFLPPTRPAAPPAPAASAPPQPAPAATVQGSGNPAAAAAGRD